MSANMSVHSLMALSVGYDYACARALAVSLRWLFVSLSSERGELPDSDGGHHGTTVSGQASYGIIFGWYVIQQGPSFLCSLFRTADFIDLLRSLRKKTENV